MKITSLKSLISLICFCLILSLTVVNITSGQENYKVGNGDEWTYEVIEGQYQYSENGKILEVGDQYDYRITSEIDSEGIYDFEIVTEEKTLRGNTGNLGILGNEAVFANWTYWEVHAFDNLQDTFLPFGDVTISNNVSLFQVVYVLSEIIHIEMVYFKDTGVLKSIKSSVEGIVALHAEIVVPDTRYGLQIAGSLAVLILLSLPYLRDRKRKRERYNSVKSEPQVEPKFKSKSTPVTETGSESDSESESESEFGSGPEPKSKPKSETK